MSAFVDHHASESPCEPLPHRGTVEFISPRWTTSSSYGLSEGILAEKWTTPSWSKISGMSSTISIRIHQVPAPKYNCHVCIIVAGSNTNNIRAICRAGNDPTANQTHEWWPTLKVKHVCQLVPHEVDAKIKHKSRFQNCDSHSCPVLSWHTTEHGVRKRCQRYLQTSRCPRRVVEKDIEFNKPGTHPSFVVRG
jgi:hypothetical protein